MMLMTISDPFGMKFPLPVKENKNNFKNKDVYAIFI